MDLQAHTFIGSTSSRWAKMLAFCCFAVACGLLAGSLKAGNHGGPAAVPSEARVVAPLV